MKKRIVALSLALVFALMTASIGLANVGPQSVSGFSSISASGKTVSYQAQTSSTTVEPKITVSVTLKRLVGSQWQLVDSTSASKQNSTSAVTSDSCNVTGGYYYKAFATHTSTSGGIWSSESNQLWVP